MLFRSCNFLSGDTYPRKRNTVVSHLSSREWGMLYFPGCALFINGVFLILPTAWVLATSYFSGLAIKVPAVYAAVTGVLYHCTRVGLVAGIVLAVLGLAAIVGSTIGRRKAAR